MLNTIILWVGWLGWVGNAILAAASPGKYARTTARARVWAFGLFLAALTGTVYLLTNRVESRLIVFAIISANALSLTAGSRLLAWRPESAKAS